MRLRTDDIDLPAPRGARLLAAGLLREAGREIERLEKGEGEESLHDFRVALRRLRSVLRALRPWLGSSVRRGQERRLRAVARATTPARDAEVQLAWIAGERGMARPRELPGLAWLERRLSSRIQDDYARTAREAAAAYRKVARRVGRRLERRGAPRGESAAAVTLGAALAELAQAHAAALWAALDAISGPMDVEKGHEARIDAKRLRYLLEPLRGCAPADAEPAVTLLRELQEILGELHDAHVAAGLAAEALGEAALERARQAHAAVAGGEGEARALLLAGRSPYASGLLALDRRAVERARAAHARLAREWMPAHRSALAGALDAVVAALGTSAGSPPPVRRFLLARLPAEIAGVPGDEIETGWLPGPSPRGWLLEARGEGGTRWFRGEEGGTSPGAEIDEATFAALWPATGGQRLAVRRRALGARWPGSWVDEVAGLRIVLARLPGPLASPLPRLLREVLVREVTEERAYRDQALAARQQRARAAPPPESPEGAPPLPPPRPAASGDPPAVPAEEVGAGATAPGSDAAAVTVK